MFPIVIYLMGHVNKNNHKARHGGYRQKPTRRESAAAFNFFGDINAAAAELHVKQTQQLPEGTQLKIKF